jgi:hypothetical protein
MSNTVTIPTSFATRFQNEADARKRLQENEIQHRNFEAHKKPFPPVKVRVRVEFNLGFGRTAQVGEIVTVPGDDAEWLCSERCGAWAERV